MGRWEPQCSRALKVGFLVVCVADLFAGTLKLTNLTLGMSGAYFCNASNDAGHANCTITLEVNPSECLCAVPRRPSPWLPARGEKEPLAETPPASPSNFFFPSGPLGGKEWQGVPQANCTILVWCERERNTSRSHDHDSS